MLYPNCIFGGTCTEPPELRWGNLSVCVDEAADHGVRRPPTRGDAARERSKCCTDTARTGGTRHQGLDHGGPRRPRPLPGRDDGRSGVRRELATVASQNFLE